MHISPFKVQLRATLEFTFLSWKLIAARSAKILASSCSSGRGPRGLTKCSLTNETSDSPWLGEARPGSRLLLRLSKCPPVPVTLAPAQLEGQKGDNSIYARQGAGFFVLWVFSGRKQQLRNSFGKATVVDAVVILKLPVAQN